MVFISVRTQYTRKSVQSYCFIFTYTNNYQKVLLILHIREAFKHIGERKLNKSHRKYRKIAAKFAYIKK